MGRGYSAKAFTYHSQSSFAVDRGGRKQPKSSYYYLAIALIEVDRRFPKMYIRPTHCSDKLADFLRFNQADENLVLKTEKCGTHYRILTSNQLFAQQLLGSEKNFRG